MEETGVELQQLLDEVTLVVHSELFVSKGLLFLQERLSSIPLLIMANKQDLMSAATPNEVRAYYRISNHFSHEFNIPNNRLQQSYV